MPQVLLVEGEAALRQDLARQLVAEGFGVTALAGAEEARQFLRRSVPARGAALDAALVGAVLADGDGLELLRSIRTDPARRTLPVIVTTRDSEAFDRALAAEVGADDYLSLPLGPRELSARLRALLRRAAVLDAQGRGPRLEFGPVVLDLAAGEARLDGVLLGLTRRELELLAFFLEHAHKVLPRERILHAVWGLEYLGESRTIDAHVRRLRAKLGPAAGMIETIVGVGYRLGGV